MPNVQPLYSVAARCETLETGSTHALVLIVKQLLRVFADAFGDWDAYQSAVPQDEYLRSLLAKPYFIVLVAVASDKVVGGLAAYVLEKFEQERREIYSYDLAVQELHRRKGIATKLINEIRHVAHERANDCRSVARIR